MRGHFTDFEAAYGDDAHGNGTRADQGELGRFRSFTREWVAECSDSLDIAWLKDDSVEDAADLPEPGSLSARSDERTGGGFFGAAGDLGRVG